MLTKQMLLTMPPQTVFARGEIVDSPEGVNMTNSGKMLKWLAVRGDIEDWTIYLHWATSSWNYILESGDKPMNENNIKKLVPCDDEAFSLFRH